MNIFQRLDVQFNIQVSRVYGLTLGGDPHLFPHLHFQSILNGNAVNLKPSTPDFWSFYQQKWTFSECFSNNIAQFGGLLSGLPWFTSSLNLRILGLLRLEHASEPSIAQFWGWKIHQKTCRSLNIGGKTTEKNYISNDYHDYLLIHPDLSALCSDAFWNFYRGGLWTALPRPSTWHDAPVSSAHSEQSSSEWTGDWRKLHGGYPTNLVFFYQ